MFPINPPQKPPRPKRNRMHHAHISQPFQEKVLAVVDCGNPSRVDEDPAKDGIFRADLEQDKDAEEAREHE